VTPANSETFTYTHDHRLASAVGPYGSLAWTYDANGNRATQTVGSATQTFTVSPTSNRLNNITQTGQPTRSFVYVAAGDRYSDTTGSTTLYTKDDPHDRVVGFYNGSTLEGFYTYDAFSRLASRSVQNLGPTTFTYDLYDQQGHVVVETSATGVSLREYIWLDDMPVGIIDNVNTSPVLYYVHTDHLNRPIMVTNAAGAPVWTALWKPFGEPYSITGTLTYNARFPGQWFQFENGLNLNWHRHYDPTTGSYLQPDAYTTEPPDQTQPWALAGVPYQARFAANLVRGLDDIVERSAAGLFVDGLPQRPEVAADLLQPLGNPSTGGVLGSVVFADGPSGYGYAGQSPETRFDPNGLQQINGISGHAFGRMQSRGISWGAVLDACRNPAKKILQSNGNTMYCGASCTVVLSPGGWVVTVW
jgi:RHS repeat-associated protein